MDYFYRRRDQDEDIYERPLFEDGSYRVIVYGVTQPTEPELAQDYAALRKRIIRDFLDYQPFHSRLPRKQPLLLECCGPYFEVSYETEAEAEAAVRMFAFKEYRQGQVQLLIGARIQTH